MHSLIIQYQAKSPTHLCRSAAFLHLETRYDRVLTFWERVVDASRDDSFDDRRLRIKRTAFAAMG